MVTPQSRRGRALVIDHGEMLVKSLCRGLRRDCDAIGTVDVEAAWSLLSSSERFDIVFCHLGMPGCSSLALFDRVRTLEAGIGASFVFLSGNPHHPRYRSFLAGIENQCLPKPTPLQTLRDMVQIRRSAALAVVAKVP